MTGSQNDKKSRTTLVSVISEMLIPLALKAASDSFQESHFEEGKIRTLAPSHIYVAYLIDFGIFYKSVTIIYKTC